MLVLLAAVTTSLNLFAPNLLQCGVENCEYKYLLSDSGECGMKLEDRSAKFA